MDAALDRVLREEEVDVVHVHHFAHLGFGLPQGAFAHGKPVLFHLHDYHSICVRGQLVQRDLHRCEGPQESRCASCVLEHLRARPSLHFAGKLADRVGLRSTARNLVAVGNPREPDLRQIRARFQASQVAFSKIDRFLSPSQDLAQRMSEAGWAPSDRIFVEDLPLVQPIRPRKAKAQGPLRFLFVGSLIPTKGPQVLLEAAKDLACEVRFYGPAPSFDGRPQWGEELIAKIEKQDNAHYGGVFESAQRDDVYGEADVLVLPSTWEENSPLVLREGLAAGLPVIASRVGGLEEIAPNARFVAPNLPTELRRALEAEIQQGRHRWEPRSWPMSPHTKALQKHYSELIQGKSVRAPTI